MSLDSNETDETATIGRSAINGLHLLEKQAQQRGDPFREINTNKHLMSFISREYKLDFWLGHSSNFFHNYVPRETKSWITGKQFVHTKKVVWRFHKQVIFSTRVSSSSVKWMPEYHTFMNSVKFKCICIAASHTNSVQRALKRKIHTHEDALTCPHTITLYRQCVHLRKRSTEEGTRVRTRVRSAGGLFHFNISPDLKVQEAHEEEVHLNTREICWDCRLTLSCLVLVLQTDIRIHICRTLSKSILKNISLSVCSVI